MADSTQIGGGGPVSIAGATTLSGATTISGDLTTTGEHNHSGAATFTGQVKLQGNSGTAPGTGISGGSGTVCKVSVLREGTLITTKILVDLTGLDSTTTVDQVIGKAGTDPAFLTKITAAKNGTIIGGFVNVFEAPGTGQTDIDIRANSSATLKKGDAGGGTQVMIAGAGLDTGSNSYKVVTGGISADDHLYLSCGAAGTAGTYDAGKLVITLFGTV